MRTTAAAWIVLLALPSLGAGASDLEFARDNQVLTAVLRDLIGYQGEDSPLRPPFGPPQPLPFASDPWYGTISATEALRRLEDGPWEALTKSQVLASQEAARNLAQRSKKQVRDFAINEPGVGHWDSTRERSEAATPFNRPVRAFPPGYSSNQRLAIVRLTIPWSIHVVNTTYVLSLESGSWTVLIRQFGYVL